MPKPRGKGCYRTSWGECASVGRGRQSTESDTSAGQVPSATHRQHGIEEVRDEGSAVLHSLLSLGEIGHRVTWEQRPARDFSAHLSVCFPTGAKALCREDAALMPHPGLRSETAASAQGCLAVTAGALAAGVSPRHVHCQKCCLAPRELPSGRARGPRARLSAALRYLKALKRAAKGAETVGTLPRKNMGVKLPRRKILFSATQTAALTLCGQTLPFCGSLLYAAARAALLYQCPSHPE